MQSIEQQLDAIDRELKNLDSEKTKLLSKRSVNTGSVPVKFFKSHMLLKFQYMAPVRIFGYFSQKHWRSRNPKT